MATYSCILARKIPWTEESLRFKESDMTEATQHAHITLWHGHGRPEALPLSRPEREAWGGVALVSVFLFWEPKGAAVPPRSSAHTDLCIISLCTFRRDSLFNPPSWDSQAAWGFLFLFVASCQPTRIPERYHTGFALLQGTSALIPALLCPLISGEHYRGLGLPILPWGVPGC